MSFSTSNSTFERRAFSSDGAKFQVVNLVAQSGDTSGTVTADELTTVQHIFLPPGYRNTSAPTFSGNVATLAFTVRAETAASATKGGVTYTAVANLGAAGNDITVTYTGSGTAGAEEVTVVGSAISVKLQNGVSTITQVRTAVNLSAAAAALVTATGTSGTGVATATATSLSGGVSGGAYGPCLLIGR